uniref:Uncharacterized protein n=1 Tax=Leptobrachium leishanense TaxID=445787 RepID=A0A8C5QRA9_9ANUR
MDVQMVRPLLPVLLFACFVSGREVCYDKIGCFSDDKPWSGTVERLISRLPWSPEEIGVRFLLRTRENPVDFQVVLAFNESTLVSSNFKESRKSRFVIHGFMSDGEAGWVTDMCAAILSVEDVNCFCVDWSNGAHTFYSQAANNVRVVGAVIAYFIEALVNTTGYSPSNVYLIGHSLGAQAAGQAGRRTPGLSRITGFKGYGTSQVLGNLDFFPNGGKKMPGCELSISIIFHPDELLHEAEDLFACDHLRSYKYFTESITHSEGFIAFLDNSYENFEMGAGFPCPLIGCPLMGYYADEYIGITSKHQMFYLNTAAEPPYTSWRYKIILKWRSLLSLFQDSQVSIHGKQCDTTQDQIYGGYILENNKYVKYMDMDVFLGEIDTVIFTFQANMPELPSPLDSGCIFIQLGQNGKLVQEVPILLAAKENNVFLLKELLEHGAWSRYQTGAVGETPLHVAVQHNNVEAAQILLEKAPDLINQPMTSQLHLGQTALHIATVNENMNLVQMLIDKGADVASPRATGTFFALSPENLFYFGEHVLTFAACVGNLDIAKLLLDHGADLRAQDCWGNTILHILVLQPNTAVCCQVLDFLLSQEDTSQEPPLDQITNKQGLTPLKLAAAEGNVTMFQHLVQKKRKVHSTFGPVTSMLYDLSEIDSLEKEPSVLELIATSKKSKARKILNFPPVKSLLKRKWQRSGRPYFWLMSVVYVLYMACVSMCCVYRPIKHRELPPSNTTDPQDITLYVQKTFQESYLTPEDRVRMCGEIVSVIGAVLLFLLEISCVFSAGIKYYLSFVLWAEPFHIVRLSFSSMILVILVLRLTSTKGEEVLMSIALVLGWCYVMYFARGFKMFGPFTIIIQKMAASDLLTFCWLMAVVVIGYSTALFIVFQTVDQSKWGAFYPYTQSLISTFQLFLNIIDGPANYDVDVPLMYSFTYASFCVIAFLLMFNLLIAVMGDTQSSMAKKKTLWSAQITSLTLTMEQKLPKRLWLNSNSFEHDLEGKRYFGVEEGKWPPLSGFDGSDSSDESDEELDEGEYLSVGSG